MRCFQVNAFTSRPFAGNPAAVCLVDRVREDAWLQAVAAEMNLSETAYVRPLEQGYELRWFTPAVEVDLCGHATLAAAHTLWEAGIAPLDQTIEFDTRSGRLTAARRGDQIELDFPATPPAAADPPAGLLAALGAAPTFVGKSRFDYFLVLQSAAEVRALQPDFGRLAAIDVRGIIVTSASDDPRFDFISRFFAPGAGINEDPVTGSAHCCLAPFWESQLGRPAMTGYQASARGGVVRVQVAGDRVILGGQGVTIWRGALTDATLGARS
ncbi:MAG: PhzF family phenazine biosynthesis protein [Planctomycetaceae bacterium]|nr:PhzF family phenazine biosynthesis protein [Planctomycetaceae bacterium]